MKIIENLNKPKVIKSFKYIIISIISLYILVAIYSFIFEQDKLTIDRYNFEQLEKVKLILKDISKKEMDFYTLKSFNETYDIDIKPIKNCYYLSFDNGDKPFIFGFQLESMIYKFLHFGKNYAYPSYSIPIRQYCLGEGPIGSGGCFYTNKEPFIETISI